MAVFAVFTRADTGHAAERAGQGRIAAVADHAGDLHHAEIGALQKLLGPADTKLTEVQAGQYTGAVLKPVGLIGGVIIFDARQLLDGDRQVIVLANVADGRCAAVLGQLAVQEIV